MKNVIVTALIASLGLSAHSVNASSTPLVKKKVSTSSKVKISKALRDLKPLQEITPQRKIKLKQSGEPVPGEDLVKIIPNRFPFAKKSQEKQKYSDPVLQKTFKKRRNLTNVPEFGLNIDGMTNPQGFVPPDTNGSVGPNHYVQTVNVSLAIWDKDGTQLVEPIDINSLWDGFGGICETSNSGDPIVLYDRRADRWMISQFAIQTGAHHQCIAVSQTGDPTGAYYLYAFEYGELFNDYPHFGIFGDAYYMGVNQFGDSFAGGGMVAYERDKMLSGAEAQQIIISGEGFSPTVFTPMPLDVDGIAQPPADMNQYFLWADSSSSDRIHVWEMDIDWSNPENAEFREVETVDVSPYSAPDNATQPNGEELDALGLRSMFRTSYRNIDGQGKILFTHNIEGPSGQPVARWYQFNVDHDDNNAVTLAQEGTFSPDSDLAPSSTARWMVSGAMDAQGNIAIGYTVSSDEIFPSIHAATRLATDPAGEMTDEFVLVEGTGSQGAVNRGRWADYASMSIDPVDDCTFWYTNEYYKAENNDTLTWSTRISSFKIPSCTMGPTGEISGTVTDAVTGESISRATVSAGNISTVTNADGEYTMVLPVGDYDLSVFRYGWVEATQADVTVDEDDELTNDFALTAAERVELVGTVKEATGSEHPLYAKISASVPGDTIVTYSNPETGEYELPVFEGTTINVTVRAEGVSGYQMTNQDVLPLADATAPMALDFTLDVDSSCIAPGFQFIEPSFVQRFESGVFPPEGWTVTDDAGNDAVWQSALAGRGNLVGSEGDAALADSDDAGTVDVDTSLVTPIIDVTDISSNILRFTANYRTFTGADAVDVDISVDGGAWTNVQGLPTGIRSYEIDLSTFIDGATSFQLRWRYYDANFEWYALVDDITIGESGCLPITGNFVASYVNDANTGLAVNNAIVTVGEEEATTSGTTSDDEALDDGFIYFFVPQDEEISISAFNYATSEVELAELMLATPVELQAGQLVTSADSLSATLTQGRIGTDSFELSNTGGVAANFDVVLINGSSELTYGPFDSATRHMGPKDLFETSAEKIRYFPDLSYIERLAPGELVGIIDAQGGFGVAINKETGDIWNGEIELLDADADVARRYDNTGTATEDTIDTDFGGVFSADMAFNQRTGKLWQVNVGGDDCIYELDVETKVQTGNTICPNFGTSQRGLAYDPVTDTFFAGSWNDSMVHQFTTSGELIRSVNVGLPIAGLAYNPSTGHLFASLNSASSDGSFDVVIMDANSDTFVKVGGYDIQFDIDGDGDIDDVGTDNGQAGLDLSCDGTLWMNEMNFEFIFGIDSGETGVCDWKPSWASATISANSLEADGSLTVDVTFDANAPVGVNEASLVILSDTPYPSNNLPLTLTVEAPQYGQLDFTVTHIDVDEKQNAVLTVERTNGSDYGVSVDFTTVDGSAIAGTDYTATSGTLTWADFDTAPKTITIPTGDLDLHKTFSVVISNPVGGANLGNKVVASVTITDVPKSGGSLGASLLALFAMAGLVRRRQLKKAA